MKTKTRKMDLKTKQATPEITNIDEKSLSNVIF